MELLCLARTSSLSRLKCQVLIASVLWITAGGSVPFHNLRDASINKWPLQNSGGAQRRCSWAKFTALPIRAASKRLNSKIIRPFETEKKRMKYSAAAVVNANPKAIRQKWKQSLNYCAFNCGVRNSITHFYMASRCWIILFNWIRGSICYSNNATACVAAVRLLKQCSFLPRACTRPAFGRARLEITCKMASFAMFLMTSFLREGAAVRAERKRLLSSLSRAVLAISRLLRPEPSWASSFSNATCRKQKFALFIKAKMETQSY